MGTHGFLDEQAAADLASLKALLEDRFADLIVNYTTECDAVLWRTVRAEASKTLALLERSPEAREP